MLQRLGSPGEHAGTGAGSVMIAVNIDGDAAAMFMDPEWALGDGQQQAQPPPWLRRPDCALPG